MSVETRLYSSRICGWAKRNYAALLEKRVTFELVPANDEHGHKTAAFLDLSPSRKTPVLEHGTTVVWESRIINEYIEEAFQGVSLMPADPSLKARARNLGIYCDDILMPLISKIVQSQTPDDEVDSLQSAVDSLEAFAFPSGHVGPYWMDQAFSLADVCYLNFFDNLKYIATKPDPVIVQLGPRLRSWGESIASRDSIVHAEEIARQFAINEVNTIITP